MSDTFETQLRKVRNERNLSIFDVVSIDDLTLKDIELILDIANAFKEIGNRKLTLLKDRTIFNAFFENSTRTRASFELAGKKQGADVINISGKDTSVQKKETLHDTADTLNAMRADAIVIRTSKAGIPYFLAKHVNAAIINAGDGWHEHPTQALLDVMTMLEYHKTIKGKTVTIVGDILHSRVFGSLIRILGKLEANVRVASPATFVPKAIESTFPCKIYFDVEEAIKGSDVVYALRVQEERGADGFIPTIREYSKAFGISTHRFSLADENAILMHAGPVIRDIDVHSALMAIDRSRIRQQVENGLAIRSALLWLVASRTDKKWKTSTLI